MSGNPNGNDEDQAEEDEENKENKEEDFQDARSDPDSEDEHPARPLLKFRDDGDPADYSKTFDVAQPPQQLERDSEDEPLVSLTASKKTEEKIPLVICKTGWCKTGLSEQCYGSYMVHA